MTETITYIDRITKKQSQELVYGAGCLRLLYGDTLISKLIGRPLAFLAARFSIFSKFYGYLQNLPSSQKKVIPFIKKFGIDTSEFEDNPCSYTSFNDFFIRKLKPASRPIASNEEVAIIPADGRYLFFENISKTDGFLVKGKKFTLEKLLQSQELANQYEGASLVIARLCPTDYHRFHFPCGGFVSETKDINGLLYSVNPIALKKNIEIFSENKRTLCTIENRYFGKVLFLEIGATFVGSIHQTYLANTNCSKGDEKGYFSFGGSSLILLFEKGRIEFDKDLLKATKDGFEIRCLMGQSMGKSMGVSN